MNVYTGESLKDYTQTELAKLESKDELRSRFCQKDLMSFLETNDSKICGIYGLRRTGKTTLMLQTIRSMNQDNRLKYEDIVLIRCTNNDNYIDIERILDEIPQKYIFIDEITKAENFIGLASSLSDKYVDKRIVIAGTDSASLLYAKQNELYDRMTVIRTTYVSYAEYNYLLKKGLMDYIKYGGTLTDGETIYNSEENLEDYTNSSIVSNICHSVKYAKDENGYRRLYDLYQSGDLESAINKTIEKNAREFSLRVMTGVYNKSNLFGSTKELLLKHKDELCEEDIDTIVFWKDHSEICDYIMKRMNLGDSSEIKQSDIEMITNFLIKLDVLDKVDNEIFFTQTGMQHCFAELLMEGIVNTREYQSLYPQTQKKVLEKIEQDSVGHILEHIIRTDVTKTPELSKMEIGKIDNMGNGEFDLYIINPDTHNAIVYEIKRSFIDAPQQYQHLINADFCGEFERAHKCTILEKAVIYQGESKTLSNGIKYHNAEYFLSHLSDISKILSLSPSKSVLQTDSLEKQIEASIQNDETIQSDCSSPKRIVNKIQNWER